MTEEILSHLVEWGLPILGGVIFLSCLALPLPSSIVMLTCGSLVGAGDMPLVVTWLTALGSAVLGDQFGYSLGHRFGVTLIHRLENSPKRHALIDRARHALESSGPNTVFLSRWLFSPLGPYVNFLCGAAHYTWAKFTVWSILGETLWVTLYLGLGYGFGENIALISEIASDVTGIFAAIAVVFALLWYARILIHRHAEAQHANHP